MSNKISAVFAEQSQQDVKALLENVKQQMPFLVEVSESEKKGKQNMGDGAVSYVNKCLSVAQNEPNILTVNFSVAEFGKDVNLVNGLQKIRQQILTLLQTIDNTITVSGQEAMEQSNDVYAQVKLAAKKDSKYKALADELGEFYKKSKKADKKPE
jgi:hypothetical protein